MKKQYHSRGFMATYGGNVAGLLYNAGTALQFFFGLIAHSPREIASAIFNIASPCSFLFFGHRNWGVVAGGVFGIFGTLLAVYPQITHGEIGSIFGFVFFCICVAITASSPLLMRRYEKSSHAVLRATLGHPRRFSSFSMIILARMPIIYSCLTHNDWRLATVFAIWASGDLAFSFSKPHGKE